MRFRVLGKKQRQKPCLTFVLRLYHHEILLNTRIPTNDHYFYWVIISHTASLMIIHKYLYKCNYSAKITSWVSTIRTCRLIRHKGRDAACRVISHNVRRCRVITSFFTPICSAEWIRVNQNLREKNSCRSCGFEQTKTSADPHNLHEITNVVTALQVTS